MGPTRDDTIIDEDRWNAAAERIASSDQRSQKLDRFARGIRELNERWKNRFVPERESLVEAYLKGRFEIALYGNFSGTAEKRGWLLRIKCAPHEFVAASINQEHKASENCAMRRYDQLVVLVDPIKQVQAIETHLPVLVRLDFINNHFPRAGNGELYRVYSGGGYKVFPFLVEREHKIRLPQSALSRLCEGVIESTFQVVDGVPNNERQAVWDWLSGRHDRDVDSVVLRVNVNSVEARGAKFGDCGLQLIDVAVGPLNL
jgi:hypothetical protein